MPNINDVARAAGVSKATVSRVLNNKEIVSDNTKEKVYAAIEKLQYQPNLIGRMLRTSETQKVLVLLPDIANSFFSTVIRGISAQAQEYGYTVMTGMTRSSLQKEESYIELLENRVIEGIILLSSNMDAERITELSKRRPIVQCSEYVVESDTSGVYINNEQAAYEAVSHLIELNHTNIGFIGSDRPYRSGIDRENGFIKAMRENDLPVRHCYHSDYSLKDGYNYCMTMLSHPQPPTAIFAVSDWLAVGVLDALYDTDHLMEVSVVGFDDSSIARAFRPQITTVSQPRFEMGKTAMKLLREKIVNINSPNIRKTVEHKLVIRDTTRNGRAW